jgi:hypothetical protein
MGRGEGKIGGRKKKVGGRRLRLEKLARNSLRGSASYFMKHDFIKHSLERRIPK